MTQWHTRYFHKRGGSEGVGPLKLPLKGAKAPFKPPGSLKFEKTSMPKALNVVMKGHRHGREKVEVCMFHQERLLVLWIGFAGCAIRSDTISTPDHMEILLVLRRFKIFVPPASCRGSWLSELRRRRPVALREAIKFIGLPLHVMQSLPADRLLGYCCSTVPPQESTVRMDRLSG